MNGYRHKTRGHPSIKQLLAFLLALIVLVATTPPRFGKGGFDRTYSYMGYEV